MVRAHYFYDPMCGWCFGATTLVSILQQQAQQQGWQLELHPGGMLERGEINPQFRRHILEADQHIANLTGAQFGDAYRQRVAGKGSLVMDSMITSQAILASKALGLDEFSALKAIQQAHYQHGLDVADIRVLATVIKELASHNGKPLSSADCQQAIANARQTLHETLQHSQRLMTQLGVRGFPTLLLETEKGWQRLPHSQYYGKPQEWQNLLARLS
ncbi:DsbA family protein [Parathalassolituus penaei]|uniref:DsbA family protein n=1 Tax=Parathalassolituus penaei TaxID=2997323 RepID=A0A9X3ITT4_9GAMM|nr:DsbA family protein [Parathalassolituus penaei]MCY0966650.1 DsbA family protein [Parathalassolituus penaei]